MMTRTRAMRKVMMIALTIGLGLGVTLGVASAKGSGDQDVKKVAAKVERHTMAKVEDRLDDLDASEAQRVAIRAEARELLPALTQARVMRHAMRAEVASLASAPKLDVERAHALVDEATAQMTELGKLGVKALVASHAILTPAQRAQALSQLDDKHASRGDGSTMVKFGVEYLMRELYATKPQRALASTLRDDLLKQGQQMRGAMAQQHKLLRAQLAADRPDARVLSGAVDQMSLHGANFAHALVDGLAQFHATLDDKQREQVVARLRDMRR